MIRRRSVAIFTFAITVSLGVPAYAAADAGPTGGSWDSSNSGSALPDANVSNMQIRYVPAITDDLPTGSATLGPPSVGSASAAVLSDSASLAAVSWICSVYASDPRIAIHNSRQSVQGEGWQSCTGATYWQTAIKVTVQKYWGLGLWNNLYLYDSGYTSKPWLERIVWWYCTQGNGLAEVPDRDGRLSGDVPSSCAVPERPRSTVSFLRRWLVHGLGIATNVRERVARGRTPRGRASYTGAERPPRLARRRRPAQHETRRGSGGDAPGSLSE